MSQPRVVCQSSKFPPSIIEEADTNGSQTITNACATIALLNIVMNVPKIDLGENLSVFKAETKGLKPAYRGQALGENEFIRYIHNSFAR